MRCVYHVTVDSAWTIEVSEGHFISTIWWRALSVCAMHTSLQFARVVHLNRVQWQYSRLVKQMLMYSHVVQQHSCAV